MRPHVLILFLMAPTHQAAPLHRVPDRDAYVATLFMDTLKSHLEGGLDPDGLEVSRVGSILYIRDDSDGAKAFYEAMAHSSEARIGLIGLGFTAVVLVNKKHGTFLLSLSDNNMTKPDPVDA